LLTLVLYYIPGYSYRGIRGHLFRPKAAALKAFLPQFGSSV
jgi:hypothetical protein